MKIPKTVWALGFVSLFMDFSSELVHSLLPIFLVGSLGVSMVGVGIIEGIAEATAHIVKIFSGAISDYIGKRKVLLLLGYGLASLTKPLFPLAQNVETVFFARFTDRIGKGIRGAPRDALVADVAPKEIRGACFGLRQSMDTMGAILGPIAAILLMLVFSNNVRLVLWFAAIPAIAAMLIIVFKVKEPKKEEKEHDFKIPINFNIIKNFSKQFWFVVILGAMFMLARFSEAFLVLKASEVGFEAAWVPLVMVVMALTYTIFAYPIGKLSDKVKREYMLIVGLIILILADFTLANAKSYIAVLIGTAIWGIHMGFTQGVLATLIADYSPKEYNGTAFGIFNFVSGISMLIASIIAGVVWQEFGSYMTFYAGGVFALASLIMVYINIKMKNNLTK
ncbi:MAG: MFS transporter [Sulfurovum sp.]|nr:MFS transporter [Sulfurovum sp.]MDD3602731.1 MFS transporter [Sulfurovum sp.]